MKNELGSTSSRWRVKMHKNFSHKTWWKKPVRRPGSGWEDN